MADAGVAAFYYTFLTVFSLSVFIGMYFFYKRRDIQPIKARQLKVCLVQFLAVWLYSVGELIEGGSQENYPCTIDILTNWSIPWMLNAYTLRVWLLFTRERIQESGVQTVEGKDDDGKDDDEEPRSRDELLAPGPCGRKDPWFKYRWVVNGDYIWKIFWISSTILTIPTIAFGIDKYAKNNWGCNYSEAEIDPGRYTFMWNLGMSAACAIPLIIGAWKIRKIKDNFYIKREFRNIAAWNIFTTLLFFLFGYIDDQIEFPLVHFTNVLGVIFGNMTQSLMLPLYHTFDEHAQKEKRKPFRERVFDSVRSLKQMSGLVQLKHVLESQRGKEAFRKHLELEFAVENILFWETTNTFNGVFNGKIREKITEDPSSHSSMELIFKMNTAAVQIYFNYISEDTPMWVNLPSKVTQEVREKMMEFVVDLEKYENAMKEGMLIPARVEYKATVENDIFVTSRDAIYALMAGDSFSRFHVEDFVAHYV